MGEPSLIQILKHGSVVNTETSDWEQLLREAESHMVTELLAFLSKHSPEGTIPPVIKHKLAQIYKQNIIVNSLIKRETEVILAAMNCSNIKCIVLKGVPYAEKYYGDLGVRKSGDIDLLVEERTLKQAIGVLIELGYTQDAHDTNPVNLDLLYHLEFQKKTTCGVYRVELHFRFSPQVKGGLNMGGVWARALKTASGKATVYELAALDLLIFMCLHASHHRYSKVRYILDIAVLCQTIKSGFIWADFIQVVSRNKLGCQVYASLSYAALLFDVQIPRHVLEQLKPPYYVSQRLLKECSPNQLPEGISLITALLLENDANKAKDYLAMLFPARNKIRTLYGLNKASMIWPYYPIRWWEILRNIFRKY